MTREDSARLILIGGCSNTGKSTLARALGATLGAPIVDTDLFWMVLQGVMPLDSDVNVFRWPLGDPAVWSLPTDELLDRYFLSFQLRLPCHRGSSCSPQPERLVGNHRRLLGASQVRLPR
jgi:hypothetical protein